MSTVSAIDIGVLLVDDHQTVLWGLEKLIDGEKPRMHVVDKATTCREAIAAIERTKPDVVLMDLDLGGEDTLELVGNLHEQGQCKIIILTGSRDPEIRERAVMRGACGVVLKSEPADVILSAIQRVHSGEAWLDPGVTARVLSCLARNSRRRSERGLKGDPGTALTPGEQRIVARVVQYKGAPSKVIARDLHISQHTLRNHLASIYEKLGIHRRLELVFYAMEHGLDRLHGE